MAFSFLSWVREREREREIKKLGFEEFVCFLGFMLQRGSGMKMEFPFVRISTERERGFYSCSKIIQFILKEMERLERFWRLTISNI